MEETRGDVSRLLWSLLAATGVAVGISLLASSASTSPSAVFEVDTRLSLYVEVEFPDGRQSIFRVPEGTTVGGLLEQAGMATPAGADGRRAVRSGERLIPTADGLLLRGRMDGSKLVTLGLPVEVNAAGPSDLEAVPGIGRSLAISIVTERLARGAFRSAEDLARVDGMGPSTIERVRGHLSF